MYVNNWNTRLKVTKANREKTLIDEKRKEINYVGGCYNETLLSHFENQIGAKFLTVTPLPLSKGPGRLPMECWETHLKAWKR